MVVQADKHTYYLKLAVLADKLDSTVSPELKSEIIFHSGKGEKNLVIDLSGVKYIDSSGLSAILVANRRCQAARGVLVITGVEEAVLKLITISQLDTVLNIIQNPSEVEDFILMDNIENDLTQEDAE